ncbi:cytosine/adenosine deaminase-related metal-dependent hydrolase [Aminobacter niigataensis]|uniref:Cytosine/adenosine deaminase-related metal-dependent hydrolase n=1 Tax=Aminobacter niigataensis TaxID=83265 RepID=A0ABR6L2U3_9HYPH|nr:amidohydrolase family protein [Aminobacter niigataensis]MBB4650370.1 cytosine/adenosine deaminase-related metal-dependent hydrolase [Aminobacter niigataensis]
MPIKTVIRNARILTLDERDTEYAEADIVISGGKIEALGPGAAKEAGEGARIIDGKGLLAMPGLVNGHFHSPGNFMKGALGNSPLELFMLYEVPPLMDQVASPRFAYVRTMLGCIEMLKQGVTSVHDDCFFVPVVTDDEVDAVMRAYADSGIRATVTLDQPNVPEHQKYPFLKDFLPPHLLKRMSEVRLMTDAELLGCYDRFMATWHGTEAGRLRCAVSCSAPQRVTPAYLQALGRIARERDIPYNMHILETRLQRVLGQENFGKSLIRYVHDMGVLNEQAMVIHSIWVDDDDIALLAGSGCSVAHNPVSNLKIGSGVMPFRRLQKAGINVCIGNDEASTDDGIHLWTVAKVAGLVHNIGDPRYDDWPRPVEILTALTSGGAKAMRLPQPSGRLAPGFQADIILLDLNSLAFTPLNDLRRQLVYCENGSSVVTAMVGGEIVMENRKLLTVDEDAIKAEARSLAGEFSEYMARCKSAADELEPYYRQMYLKALDTPVGLNRWAGPMVP